MASTKRNWPVGRGFERYYGFLGGETNQWYPDLVYDNHPVDQPATPRGGLPPTTDLTDKAIEFIKDAKVIAPEKPFFMYFCPGATHAPHHAPEEWIEKYKGKFDMGYEALPRARVRAPEAARDLPGRRRAVAAQSLRRGEERRRQALDPRSTWSAPGTRCPTRSSACSAAWRRSTPASSRTPTMRSGGCSTSSKSPGSARTRSSCSSPTTGASGEGGPNGSVNENKFFNGIPDDIEDNLEYLDELGSPATYNHYPVGLGVGVQHAVQDVEALQLRGRRRRPDDRLVAEGHRRQGRAAPPVPPRHRRRADASTTCSASSCRRWSRATRRSRSRA